MGSAHYCRCPQMKFAMCSSDPGMSKHNGHCLGSLSKQRATAAMVVVLQALEALQVELRLACCIMSMCFECLCM